MNERINLRNALIKKFIPKDFDVENLKVEVKVKKPKTEVNILDENGLVLLWGMSVCSPEDEWDDFIGVTLAIARLKININQYLKKQKKKEKKVWTPNLGDVYYVPYMDILTRQISANKIVWTDGNLDFIRLSLGNIYRTEREARKAIRRNILNGRHIAKEARRNG